MKEKTGASKLAVVANPAPFDFSNVVKQTKRMNGTEVTLEWNSYKPETRVLGAQLISQLGQDIGAGPHPTHLVMLDLGPNTPDVAGVPSAEKSNSTVAVRWNKDGSQAVIDFSKLLMVRPLSIPRGARAHIPISRAELPGHGAVIMFHFGELRFEAIEESAKNRKDAAE